MIFSNMQALDVYPPCRVLKVGDTVPDIEAGLNAGTWSIGLCDTGSEVGLTRDEWEALTDDEQKSRRQIAADKFRAVGAHQVIPSVADLPVVIDLLNRKLQAGERP